MLQSDGDITGSRLAASSLDDTARYENSFLSSLLLCIQTVSTSTAQVTCLRIKLKEMVLSPLLLLEVFRTKLYMI